MEIVRWILVVVLAVGLGACESFNRLDGSGAPPETRMGSSVSTPTNTPETALAPATIEPIYIPATDELIGLDEAGTEALLGAPSLRRAEQNASVWHYRTEACVLFLFFYADEADVARVTYLTSSGVHLGQATPGDQPCAEAVTRAAANAEIG